MTTGSLMQDYRSPHVQLPERSRKAPSLKWKWKWKWSTEGEWEVEFKNIVAKPISNRPLAQCARRDDLDLTFEQGEAR